MSIIAFVHMIAFLLYSIKLIHSFTLKAHYFGFLSFALHAKMLNIIVATVEDWLGNLELNVVHRYGRNKCKSTYVTDVDDVSVK